jgi:hypothetical protein
MGAPSDPGDEDPTRLARNKIKDTFTVSTNIAVEKCSKNVL